MIREERFSVKLFYVFEGDCLVVDAVKKHHTRQILVQRVNFGGELGGPFLLVHVAFCHSLVVLAC